MPMARRWRIRLSYPGVRKLNTPGAVSTLCHVRSVRTKRNPLCAKSLHVAADARVKWMLTPIPKGTTGCGSPRVTPPTGAAAAAVAWMGASNKGRMQTSASTRHTARRAARRGPGRHPARPSWRTWTPVRRPPPRGRGQSRRSGPRPLIPADESVTGGWSAEASSEEWSGCGYPTVSPTHRGRSAARMLRLPPRRGGLPLEPPTPPPPRAHPPPAPRAAAEPGPLMPLELRRWAPHRVPAPSGGRRRAAACRAPATPFSTRGPVMAPLEPLREVIGLRQRLEVGNPGVRGRAQAVALEVVSSPTGPVWGEGDAGDPAHPRAARGCR